MDDDIKWRYKEFYESHRNGFDGLEDVIVKADVNKRNLLGSASFEEYQLRSVLSGMPKCMLLEAEEFDVLKTAYGGTADSKCFYL